jgi:hypothetical protein
LLNCIQKVFLLNTESDKNATHTRYFKIIDKKNYVLALDTQRISNKKECLYFWYSTPTENIVACAVDPKLQSVLLTRFTNKKKNCKHTLINKKKEKHWDPNVENTDDYLRYFFKDLRQELTITLKANGKKNKNDGVYKI